MTGKDIFKAIGEAEDEMIEELEQPIKKKNHALRWVALAACLCLAVGIGAVVMKEGQPPQPTPVPSVSVETLTTPEPMPVPVWEEREIWNRFPSMGNYTCYGGTMAEEQVGELLETVTLTGQDPVENVEYTIQAEVYAIGFPTGNVRAVRYEGNETYYAFVEKDAYHPETLGQLIEDLNLREDADWRDIAYQTSRTGISLYVLHFGDVPEEELWDKILSQTDAPNLWQEQEDRDYEFGADLRLTLPITGERYFDFKITRDGYLTTNLLGSENIFYIGEKITVPFADYVEERFEGERKQQTGSGGGEVSTPPYDPAAQAAPSRTPAP